MFKNLLVLVLGLLIGFSSGADDHDDHGDFPEGALLVLEGKDAVSGDECFLFVMDRGFSGPEELPSQYFLKVQTGYSHGADSAGEFTLKPAGAGQSTMVGTGSNGQDQIALLFDGSVLDLKNARTFNLKWKHGTHFHNSRCNNLVEHVH